MEQYVDVALRYWSDFASWTPPRMAYYTILGFGVLSAAVISRISAAPPLFAGPISFIVLTFAAMVSNYVGRQFTIMGTTDLQKAILFTALGHAVAGILLLAILKVGEKRTPN
jgi:hypothetical protein